MAQFQPEADPPACRPCFAEARLREGDAGRPLAERRRSSYFVTYVVCLCFKKFEKRETLHREYRITTRGAIKKHNYGSNKFTKRNDPFQLVYREECADKTEARKRENFLKSGVGRKYLDGIL